MRVIDIRCRMITQESLAYFSHIEGVQAHNTEAGFFDWLTKSGIHTALSPTPASLGLKLGRWELPPRHIDNDAQASLQMRYPGRFIGVAGIDPGNEVHRATDELERCVNTLGLRITTIEPGRLPLLARNPADRRLDDFYSLSQELEVPVIIQSSGLKGGISLDYAHPTWIDDVAHRFPRLNLICAHGCVPFFRELEIVLRRRPNVFASPDCYTFRDFQSVRSYPPHQIIFASAYPFGSTNLMLARYLTANWKRRWLDDILYRNAIRALRLEGQPVFSSWMDSAPIYGYQERTMAYANKMMWRGGAAVRKLKSRSQRPVS